MGRGLPTEALLHGWGKGQLPSLQGLQNSSLCSEDSTPEHTGICSVAVRWGALKGSTSWLEAGSYALWVTREGVKVMEGDTDGVGTRDDIPSFSCPDRTLLAFLGFNSSGTVASFPSLLSPSPLHLPVGVSSSSGAGA